MARVSPFGTLLFGLLLLSRPGVASGQPTPAGDLYVLSVGVEAQLTARRKLDIYAQDAKFVADALAAGKPLFRKVEPTLINGSQATRVNVLKALATLKTQVRPQDTAVVFFSAHGGIEPFGYAIYLANGPGGESEMIAGAELVAAVAAVKGKAVVMLDTCSAAGVLAGRPKGPANVAFLTACRANESSYGQEENKKKPHGFFVVAACEGLAGAADADKNELVTVAELDAYIQKRATALCGEQHAVCRTPAGVAGVALAQVPAGQSAAAVPEPGSRRNPFGLADVNRPLGKDVLAFAAKTPTPGANDDDNARPWNTRGVGGKADALDGDWEYRWRSGPAADGWLVGAAQVRVANGRVFLSCRDRSGKYLIEGRLDKDGRIVGRYSNANDANDNGPFVGRQVGPERIDGYWSGGRWDFRRTAQK